MGVFEFEGGGGVGREGEAEGGFFFEVGGDGEVEVEGLPVWGEREGFDGGDFPPAVGEVEGDGLGGGAAGLEGEAVGAAGEMGGVGEGVVEGSGGA